MRAPLNAAMLFPGVADVFAPERTEDLVRFLWPRQVEYRQHLIGPTFLPVYLLVLKVALAIAFLVTAGFAVLGPTGDAEIRPRLVEVLAFFIRRSLIVFGWITLAFTALDLWRARPSFSPPPNSRGRDDAPM